MAATPILDAITAILADGTLSVDEQSLKIKQTKAQGLYDALVAFGAFPQQWGFSKSGITYTVTIVTASVVGYDLSITLAATKNGTNLRINNPVVLRNAPCQVAGGGVKTYDPVNAVRSVLGSVVSGG